MEHNNLSECSLLTERLKGVTLNLFGKEDKAVSDPGLLSKKGILNPLSSACLPPHLPGALSSGPGANIAPWGDRSAQVQVFRGKEHSEIAIWWPRCRTHSLVNFITNQVSSYPLPPNPRWAPQPFIRERWLGLPVQDTW